MDLWKWFYTIHFYFWESVMNIQVLIIIIIGSLLVCSTSKVFTITERATYSPSFNRTNRDRGKIHALFDRRTCEDILAVPLNQLSSPDKLIWKENRTHSFSVRTAYTKWLWGWKFPTKLSTHLSRSKVPHGHGRSHSWTLPPLIFF